MGQATRTRSHARTDVSVARHPLIRQLIAARNRRGLSLTDLAAVIGCDRMVLHRWENEINSPSLENFTAWAAALGFTLDLVALEG